MISSKLSATLNVMKANSDRRRRFSFDEVAKLYDEVRPQYPNKLITDILRISDVQRGSKILEVGCGTGQATLQFAPYGIPMVCLEPGKEMASIAKRRIKKYPNVKIEQVTFEEFQAVSEEWDLLIAATAFHWISPEVGYKKAASLLKPRGTFALFWNMLPTIPSDVQAALEGPYQSTAPEIHKELYSAEKKNVDEEIESGKKEIDAIGLFTEVHVKRYPWQAKYTAEQYANLLCTYANYHALLEQKKSSLLAAITSIIEDRFQNEIVLNYVSSLLICYKAENSKFE